MAAITVRNLPDETHRALKSRARAHGRSTEAEVRAILVAATNDPDRIRVGTLLSTIGQETGGVDLELSRDTTDHGPIDLSS